MRLCVHLLSQFTDQEKRKIVAVVRLTDCSEEKQSTKTQCLNVDQKK